jgi:hypothetical protein
VGSNPTGRSWIAACGLLSTAPLKQRRVGRTSGPSAWDRRTRGPSYVQCRIDSAAVNSRSMLSRKRRTQGVGKRLIRQLGVLENVGSSPTALTVISSRGPARSGREFRKFENVGSNPTAVTSKPVRTVRPAVRTSLLKNSELDCEERCRCFRGSVNGRPAGAEPADGGSIPSPRAVRPATPTG